MPSGPKYYKEKVFPGVPFIATRVPLPFLVFYHKRMLYKGKIQISRFLSLSIWSCFLICVLSFLKSYVGADSLKGGKKHKTAKHDYRNAWREFVLRDSVMVQEHVAYFLLFSPAWATVGLGIFKSLLITHKCLYRNGTCSNHAQWNEFWYPDVKVPAYTVLGTT